MLKHLKYFVTSCGICNLCLTPRRLELWVMRSNPAWGRVVATYITVFWRIWRLWIQIAAICVTNNHNNGFQDKSPIFSAEKFTKISDHVLYRTQVDGWETNCHLCTSMERLPCALSEWFFTLEIFQHGRLEKNSRLISDKRISYSSED
jgi:hypothetical protein